MGIQERDDMRRGRNKGGGHWKSGGHTWRPVVILLAVLGLALFVSQLRNSGSRSAATSPIDVNHASRNDLLQLSFLSEKVVDAIITSRPYASVDDVIRAYGVGPKTLERLRPYITVSPGSNTALERPSPP